MVHILRYKTDDTETYLIVGLESTVNELKQLGYEHVSSLSINEKGVYNSTQLMELLNSRYEGIGQEIEQTKIRLSNLEETKVKIKEFLDKFEKNPN